MKTNQPQFIPKTYHSQIGQADLFWERDCRNGEWVLGRQLYFKNGRPKSGWIEEKRLVPKLDPVPEKVLLKAMAQAENDLIFQLASGDRPKPK
jgi:hypothetical protein